MSVNQIQFRGFRTRALGTLFHKMNNDLMTIRQSIDLSRRDEFRPCSRDSSGDKVNFVLLAKKKQKHFLIGIGRPFFTVSRLYLSSCAIWLLQNFSPTTYRPPLPSRLLTRYSKPSKFTTNKIYLLPVSEIYKLHLLNVNSKQCNFGLHGVKFEITQRN